MSQRCVVIADRFHDYCVFTAMLGLDKRLIDFTNSINSFFSMKDTNIIFLNKSLSSQSAMRDACVFDYLYLHNCRFWDEDGNELWQREV